MYADCRMDERESVKVVSDKLTDTGKNNRMSYINSLSIIIFISLMAFNLLLLVKNSLLVLQEMWQVG